MKKKTEEKKQPVERPATGTTRVNVNISMPIEMAQKLITYAKENETTKSAVVVDLLKNIL